MKPSVTTKLATIEDVARAAGVARSTASGAFSGKKRMSDATRENILRIARDLNFEPNPHAQRLSTQRSHNLVGLFTPYLDLTNTTLKVKIIQHLLTEQGFESPIYTAGAYSGSVRVDQRALLGAFCRQRPEAILCFTGDMEPDAGEELRHYQDKGGIVVCFDYALPALACDQVVFDREDNAYQAASYLLKQGHRRIGFYYNQGGNAAGCERRTGFERALQEAGVAVREDWLLAGTPDEALYEGQGMEMARKVLRWGEERPTAICGFPELVAASFVSELHRSSGLRVPEDLSVMTTDDTPMARYGPVPFTTTTHPVQEIAYAATELVTGRLRGTFSGEPRRVSVRGALVERESVRTLSVGGAG
jgi:LacI family purine nucleotide synthesis repressor